MKTLKLYWLRFKSKTPKHLKKIQIFLSAILVPIAGALGVMAQWNVDKPLLHSLLTNALITIPFMVLILQFATSDKAIQKLDKNDL